jgi:hypothetical protein
MYAPQRSVDQVGIERAVAWSLEIIRRSLTRMEQA